MPLDISYTPKDATISTVKLGVFGNGALVRQVNLPLSPTNMVGPGLIRYRDLTVPRFANVGVLPRVAFNIQIVGTVTGQMQTVQSHGDTPNTTLVGNYSFRPLYLANENATLAARRYGVRDPAAIPGRPRR